MKEFISIITAADEHFTASEYILYGVVYPLALMLSALALASLIE